MNSMPPSGVVPRLIIPTPSGRPFTQVLATRYASEPWLVFACGRYEGIDARVVEEARTRMPVDEVSLGDFVLAGGEVAVLVMIEAIGRLLPGVLGNADSVADDSFAPGAMESLLEGPVYTKPPSGGNGPCRRSSCRAITARSPAGGETKRFDAPRGTAPTCSIASPRTTSTNRTAPSSAKPVFRLTAKIWQTKASVRPDRTAPHDHSPRRDAPMKDPPGPLDARVRP